MKKKVLSLLLASAMILSMTACGGGSNGDDSDSQQNNESTPGAESTPETTPDVDVNANWDGAYIDADDYRAYISHDLEQLVADIQDQLTADELTAVEAAEAAGLEAIANAGTVAEVRAAYTDAFNAVVNCIPVADGLISFAGEDNAEKTEMLGIIETYGIRNNIVGLSMFENGGTVMYNPRVTLGTENYIVGYGFGILAEGAITADLDYESNPDWKRYYHSLNASDPGTLNMLNDQGSEVDDFYSYITASFYTTFMNDTKDGYDWVPELAMEMPVPLNEENGTATKWRFQVRTGAEGLKYTTGSQIPSRAAFNDREVALEDYETPFKLLLTQSNELYRGSEMANQTNSGAIVGAKAYYDGSANGYNEALWEQVGIKTYEEDGKSYFEVEFVTPLSRFYAMYYISSSLYMPVPQEFLDLVTVQNYLGFNNNATETPVDNSLSLGAYYVEAYNQDQEVVYKKNPNYVFADTKYSIEGVHIRILPAMGEDTEASINEFLAEHSDAASIPQTRLDEFRNDPRTRTTTGDSVFKLNVNTCDPETWELLFGEEGTVTQTPKDEYWEVEPALGNEHFIKALNYSIDRLTFANARGSIPSVDYLSSNYMSDPENGVAYSSTDAHKKAVAPLLEETDGSGYSLELAREYFRVALTELENEGAYTPGTDGNPTVIHLEIAWMYAQHEENYHNELKAFLETAFNDPSVSGGKYELSVDFWVGNDWSDVYYVKMLAGQYDIAFGSITGNSLDPLGFMNILSADQSIANGFTLCFGVDTNDPDVYPLVYKGERYSYDAFYNAANGQGIVAQGVNEQAVSLSYESMVKNEDGSYTGAFVVKAALPDLTVVTPVAIACCEYERYYNGDGVYDETYVDFETEDEGNGVLRVTFTVPADLAADYATGSGTSENPQGATGFDFYYDYTLNGVESTDNYYSVEDVFEVE
ncbi:MAG: hypothetical protein HDQ98_05520 [Lachnospiraceae bacterium]|nr:hypothetical protein [Lachnospiraceae bacterium]